MQRITLKSQNVTSKIDFGARVPWFVSKKRCTVVLFVFGVSQTRAVRHGLMMHIT